SRAKTRSSGRCDTSCRASARPRSACPRRAAFQKDKLQAPPLSRAPPAEARASLARGFGRAATRGARGPPHLSGALAERRLSTIFVTTRREGRNLASDHRPRYHREP